MDSLSRESIVIKMKIENDVPPRVSKGCKVLIAVVVIDEAEEAKGGLLQEGKGGAGGRGRMKDKLERNEGEGSTAWLTRFMNRKR
jgi:hypothetical protein